MSARLAAWLTDQPWCGPLFASERVGGLAGALPMSIIGCDGPRSPDLLMSFPWRSDANSAGYPGHAPATGGAPGQGQHGSLSRHELRNTGLAGGPSFRKRAVVATPTGNIDVAPTVLHLLGIASDTAMDGRVLNEALATGQAPPAESQTYSASHGGYGQEVRVSTVGHTNYVDWGNRL